MIVNSTVCDSEFYVLLLYGIDKDIKGTKQLSDLVPLEYRTTRRHALNMLGSFFDSAGVKWENLSP